MSEVRWHRALLPLKRSLELPYALALAGKNLAYAYGLAPARRLSWPVVSVGNLSVGGAGKTPVVIALAQLLKEHGVPVDVLSRGYGRRSPLAVERVLSEGHATRFGDEPLLIARAAGVPVYVGASRLAAGQLAEQESPGQAGIHLLDDGFQHRRLARTIDIVVVHPSDRLGRLLPAGRLREPLSALLRADFLILREEDQNTAPALHEKGIDKPVWRIRRTLAPPRVEGSTVAFCGIAHPGEFFEGLRQNGLDLRHTLRFTDHHAYSLRDLRSIAAVAQGAAALLTTEKDLVRLSQEARLELGRTAPLLAVPLQTTLIDEGACMRSLVSLLAERRSAAPAMRR